eukprot:ctg_459.g147
MSRFGCPRSLLAWCPPFLFLSTASKRVRAIGALAGSRQRWWARSGRSSRRTACPSVNSLRPVTMSAARDAAETETPEATAPTAATDTLHTSLRQLQLQATFTAELPADPERKNFVRAVSNAAFTHIPLQAAWPAPELIAWSHDCAVDCFDLRLSSEERALAARVFSGMELLPGSVPYAQRYGGHQFAAQQRSRIPGQRGAAPPGHSYHAGAFPGGYRRVGGARHVLQRGPARGARGDRVPRGAILDPLRDVRVAGAAGRTGLAAATGRLLHPLSLSGIAGGGGDEGGREGDYSGRLRRQRRGGHPRWSIVIVSVYAAVVGGGAAHCATGGAVAERRFCARRAQHRQYEHSGIDHGLWTVWLFGRIRTRLHAQHHRPAGPAVLLCHAADGGRLECTATGRGAAAAVGRRIGDRCGRRGISAALSGGDARAIASETRFR